MNIWLNSSKLSIYLKQSGLRYLNWETQIIWVDSDIRKSEFCFKNMDNFELFRQIFTYFIGVRDWHFSFKTSRFRKFCQIFEGFGFDFRKFGLGKKVSVSVSKKFGLGKKSRFQKIWFRKKVSVSVSKKFGLGKKSRSRFRKIWSRKKNPNNKNSARNDVPNLGLGPNWNQSPEMVPYKS